MKFYIGKFYSWHYYYWDDGETKYVCRFEKKFDVESRKDWLCCLRTDLNHILNDYEDWNDDVPDEAILGYKQAHEELQKYLAIL